MTYKELAYQLAANALQSRRQHVNVANQKYKLVEEVAWERYGRDFNQMMNFLLAVISSGKDIDGPIPLTVSEK
jgi:hypothetical protein